MHGERIQHRLWRLGRLAGSGLIAAGLSLVGVAVGSGEAQAASAQPAAPTQPAASVPRLSHVFLIMEENNGYHDVIGNPAAPNLNYLARRSGSRPTTSESARTAASPITSACSAAARST